MAEKLSIRERARIALGDFDFTLDMLHEKMSEIFKEEAKARGLDDTSIGIAAAIIARDGNLKALGREEIEDIFLPTDAEKACRNSHTEAAEKIEKAAHDFGELYSNLRAGKQGEEHDGMKNITKVMEDIRRDVNAKGQKPARKPKEEKAAGKITTRGQYWAEVKRRDDAAKAEKAAKEAKKEEKRKRGRPKKHETGSRQTSILFSDEMREAVNQYAQFYRCSFSDAVNKLLEMAIRGRA